MVNLMSEIIRNNVSSIQIQNFRGISKEKKIKFSKNKRFVILIGENGTGKSSFVNAFEFLFKDDLGAIDFQMKDKKNAFIHKGSKPEDLNIKLDFNDKSYFEKKIDKELFKSNKGLKKFYNKHESFLSNASFILNRKKLLSFINVKDGQRFKAISDLCGLDELETYKSNINDVKKNFNKLFTDKQKEFDKLIDNLNQTLNTDAANFNEFVSKINIELENLDYGLINENTDLEEYLSTLDFSKTYEIKNNIERFNEIYDKLSFSQLNDEFEKILVKYETLSNDSLIALQHSYTIFKSAKEYFNITNSNVCPICDNEINDEILLKLDSQLTNVSENISDLNEWKKEIDNFISKLNNLKYDLSEVNKITNVLSIDCAFDESEINILINQLKEFKEFKFSILDLKESFKINDYENQLTDIKTVLDKKTINNLEDENYQKIKTLRKAINELNQLKRVEEELEHVSSKKDLSFKLFNSFNEAKKDYLTEIINNIDEDVKRYYKMIHNDDLISSPKLGVKKDNAVTLFLDCFGEEADPRKYSSEGHLDSLGLCIFLAFMKKYNPLDLIVLDDIITTVDFTHKYDIANLLVNEFSEFKILITTHNGLWAQQIERIIKTNGFNYDELNIIDWNVISGPIIKKNNGHVKLIDKYLKAKEYSAAVNTARQYLEYTTLTFCKNNTVTIKLNDKYTLYPLYEATKPVSLKKAIKLDEKNLKNADENEEVPLLEDRLNYLWNELDKNYFIVNNLSHYNDDSFFVYGGEAKHLCEIVKEICPILLSFKEDKKKN